jgi:NAD(P)-dependent dehydrogenase (short-subunit alcohol dehydrogenase family)
MPADRQPGGGINVGRSVVSSLIRTFANVFLQHFDHLNGPLICAGLRVLDRRKNEDGIELMFGTQYPGHFLLTNLLVPFLKAGAPPRVITISGEGHKSGIEGWGGCDNQLRRHPRRKEMGRDAHLETGCTGLDLLHV